MISLRKERKKNAVPQKTMQKQINNWNNREIAGYLRVEHLVRESYIEKILLYIILDQFFLTTKVVRMP